MLETILAASDYVGIFVFALSGGIVAVRKNMDIFGIVFMAFLPAIGGGTIRDILLDQPVFWLSDSITIFLVLLSAVLVFFFYKQIENFRPLRWADAAGMSLFSVTGAAKTLELDHSFFVVVIMGTLTACAGGLVRDIVANDEPLLLKSDIYATAAIIGSITYFAGIYFGLNQSISVIAGITAAFLLRALAIIYRLSLPKPG